MPRTIDRFPAKKLASFAAFDVINAPDATSRGGKLSIYLPPEPRIDYAAGMDNAYGILGRDRDSIAIFGLYPTKNGVRVRQAAMMYGWWGSTVPRPVYALLRYYNSALLVGERQVGLHTMRILNDEYGYRRIYEDRDENKKARPRRDRLGIHKGTNDTLLTAFVRAVADDRVDLRSPELLDEMEHMQWTSPKTEKDGIRAPDERLRATLSTGGSPDLVMSAMYAWHGVRHLHLYPPLPGPVYDELPEDMRDEPKTEEINLNRNRRGRR